MLTWGQMHFGLTALVILNVGTPQLRLSARGRKGWTWWLPVPQESCGFPQACARTGAREEGYYLCWC